MTAAAARPSASTVPPWRDGWALSVLLVGAVLSGILFEMVRRHDRDESRRQFEVRAAALAESVEQEILPTLETVMAVASFFESSEQVSPHEFAAFARPALKRHPSLIGLEWAPHIGAAERDRFESRVRDELGLEGYRVWEPAGDAGERRTPQRDEHFPLLYMLPGLESLRGLDLLFEEGRRGHIERARQREEVTVTERFRLVEHPPDVYTVAIYVPAFSRREGSRDESLLGLAIGLVRVERLLRRQLDPDERGRLAVAVLDRDAEAGQQLLFASAPEAADDAAGAAPDVLHELSFPVGDRTWTVQSTSLAPIGTSQPYFLLAAWLAATAVAAAGVGAARRLKRMRAQVERAKRLGQYRLVAKLGEGGMGEVYEAEHALLRRPAAVKLIRADAVGEQALVRFEREAHAASELRHPNGITVYDFGRTPDGALYYAMELVEGIDLDTLVRKLGPLPQSRVVHLLVQASAALAEAHVKGLVHRDVKPGNIMACRQGGIDDFVKVLDFGLVKLEQPIDGHAELSANVEILGTPLYMAPEQMTDPTDVGPEADVYALGAVAYYLLTGADVFSAPNLSVLIMKCLSETPKAPSRAAAHAIDPDLEALVMRCLSKDPAERPRDAGELRQLLLGLGSLAAWSEADAAEWWDQVGRPLLEEHAQAREDASERLAVAFSHRVVTSLESFGTASTIASTDATERLPEP